jgi:DNA-binding MarR family transcriptional regulator
MRTHPRTLESDHLGSIGALALAARLKRMSDEMSQDARRLYAQIGLQVEPNWFIVFSILEERGRASVTEIANAIGWAHPSVVALTRRMHERRLLEVEEDPRDGRQTLLGLSPAGRALAARARPVWEAARRGIERMLGEAGVDLATLSALEAALEQRGFRDRTLDFLDVQPARRRRRKRALP